MYIFSAFSAPLCSWNLGTLMRTDTAAFGTRVTTALRFLFVFVLQLEIFGDPRMQPFTHLSRQHNNHFSQICCQKVKKCANTEKHHGIDMHGFNACRDRACAETHKHK